MGWGNFHFSGSGKSSGSSSNKWNIFFNPFGLYGSQALNPVKTYSDAQLSLLCKIEPLKYGCPHQTIICNLFGKPSLITMSTCNCAINYKKYYTKHFTIPTKEAISSQIAQKYKVSILGWIKEIGSSIFINLYASLMIGLIVCGLVYSIGFTTSYVPYFNFIDTIQAWDRWFNISMWSGIATVLPSYNFITTYTNSYIIVDWDRINQIEKESEGILNNSLSKDKTFLDLNEEFKVEEE